MRHRPWSRNCNASFSPSSFRPAPYCRINRRTVRRVVSNRRSNGKDGNSMRALTFAILLTLGASARAAPPKVDDALADRGLQMIEARDAALRRAVERAAPSIVAIYLKERSDGFDHSIFERGRGRP